MVDDTTKACTNCGEVKPATLEFFYKKSGNKTYGLTSTCRPCASIFSREASLRYSQGNREKINKKAKDKRALNPEQYAKYDRKKYQKLRALDPDRLREVNRQMSNKRRALKLNNGHSPYSEAEVLAAYGTACHICGVPVDLEAPRKNGVEGWSNGLHIDHLQPISKGGPDTLENVRPTHGRCNARKSSKILS